MLGTTLTTLFRPRAVRVRADDARPDEHVLHRRPRRRPFSHRHERHREHHADVGVPPARPRRSLNSVLGPVYVLSCLFP